MATQSMQTSDNQVLTLASSSQSRQLLLSRICPVFQSISPNIDESRFAGEKPEALCLRLAREKAAAVRKEVSSGLIISSDQVAMLGDQQLHKPGTHENNVNQLILCQSKTVYFYTSICVLNTNNEHMQLDWTLNTATFRPLNHKQIERYVSLEQPFFCAGGFMIEGRGIALFSKLTGDDPNALIGLPMIKLITMLTDAGWPTL